MKKTIVVADRDESLQHAFMTVFSKAHFEIIHASNGKEVERIAEKMNPDVYIVNVNLPKANGIEVYKRLQKQKLLDKASFFFLKDESDTTELLGYQADGVIEKPINFFRVYETVTREDEAVELVELVEDKGPADGKGLAEGGRFAEGGSFAEGKAVVEDKSPAADKAVPQDRGVLQDKAVPQDKVVPQDRAVLQDRGVAADKGLVWGKGPAEGGSFRDLIEEHRRKVEDRAETGGTSDDESASALTDEEVKSSIRQIGARLAAELASSGGREPEAAPGAWQARAERQDSGAETGAVEERAARVAPQAADAPSPAGETPFEETPFRIETAAEEQVPAEEKPSTEEGMSIEEELKKEADEERRTRAEASLPGTFGDRLKDVMEGLTTGRDLSLADAMGGVEEAGEGQSELEAQFKTVLNQAMEEAALKLSARLAPVLTRYVEDYVKKMLLEIAEKVIREEIEKLLKESTE